MTPNEPTDLEWWIVQNLDDYIDNENQCLNEHGERMEIAYIVSYATAPCPVCDGDTLRSVAE